MLHRGPYDDNENIVINFDAMPENVASIVLGVVFDCEDDEEVSSQFYNAYVNGLPVLQFMSAEEYTLKGIDLRKKDIEERDAFIDLEKRAPPEDPDLPEDEEYATDDSEISEGVDSFRASEPEMPEEEKAEEALHAFTTSIGNLAGYNGFVPGK